MFLAELRERCQTRPEKITRWMSRYFYRKISIYLTYVFIQMGWSANAVTLVALVPALVGLYFYMQGTPMGYLYGSLMMGLFLLIDYCDGEVARYRKENTMTGLYIELFANYFVNFFIFFGISYGIHQRIQSDWVFAFGALGVMGVIFSKIRSLITWQVICVEQLRMQKRMFHGDVSVAHQVTGVNTDAAAQAPSEADPICQPRTDVNWIRKIIRAAVNPAVDDSNNINSWIAVSAMNLVLPPLTYAEYSLNWVELYFVYCVAVNFGLMILFTIRHIRGRVTERAYENFFIRRTGDFDFYF